jgi:hypothetical protein
MVVAAASQMACFVIALLSLVCRWRQYSRSAGPRRGLGFARNRGPRQFGLGKARHRPAQSEADISKLVLALLGAIIGATESSPLIGPTR